MGLLETLAKTMGGLENVVGLQKLHEKNPAIMSALIGLLAKDQDSGLTALLEGFRTKGFEKQVASWISKEANLPITGADIETALGAESLQRIAAHAQMSADQVKKGLAEILPNVVDKISPEGRIDDGIIARSMSLLSRFR